MVNRLCFLDTNNGKLLEKMHIYVYPNYHYHLFYRTWTTWLIDIVYVPQKVHYFEYYIFFS